MEKYEDEFKCLSRVAKYVLCVPITNVNTENVATLVTKEHWTSFNHASVDTVSLLNNMLLMPLEGGSTWQHTECCELQIYLNRRGSE